MAAVTAAVIAAVGGLGRAALGAYGGKKSKKTRQVDDKNPLYNAMLIEALTAMGVPVPPELALQASPLYRLRNVSPQADQEINQIMQNGINQGLTDVEIAKQVEQVGQRVNNKGKTKPSGRIRD